MKLSLENWLVGRPGKEVEAAVKAEYGVGLLHHRPYRGKAYHVVVAGAAGELPQVLSAEARLGGVYEVKLHALLLGVLYRIYAPCAGKAVVVYIGHDQQGGAAVAVQRVVYCAKAHCAHGGEHRHLAALDVCPSCAR